VLADASPPPRVAPEAAALPDCYALLGRLEPGPLTVKPRDVFAVVQAGSHQFKVTLDDVIYVERLARYSVNDKARRLL
jgi:hypothetical protein